MFNFPKFTFNAPKFAAPKFASMNFGGERSQAATFGVENTALTTEAIFDRECHAVLRKYNNREVKAREGRIKPLHANFIGPHVPHREGQMTMLLLNGNCSGIDLIMAIVAECTKRWGMPSEIVTSSLSMNQDSIDKFSTLPFRKEILLSSYFLATNPNNIVGRAYRDGVLERGNIEIGLWRTHAKAFCIHGEGYKIFGHGSANLRSAGDVNTMSMHFDAGLWEMNYRWMRHLVRKTPISQFITTGRTNANGFFTFLDQDKVKLFDDGRA